MLAGGVVSGVGAGVEVAVVEVTCVNEISTPFVKISIVWLEGYVTVTSLPSIEVVIPLTSERELFHNSGYEVYIVTLTLAPSTEVDESLIYFDISPLDSDEPKLFSVLFVQITFKLSSSTIVWVVSV